MNEETMSAQGPLGESCTIIKTWVGHSEDGAYVVPDAVSTYRLASGETLRRTPDPQILESQDGKRRYTLPS